MTRARAKTALSTPMRAIVDMSDDELPPEPGNGAADPPVDRSYFAESAIARMDDDREIEKYANSEKAFDDLVAGFVASGATDITVTIQKRNKITRKYDWIENLDAQAFKDAGSQAYLASTYGPGEYFMTWYCDNRKGALGRKSTTIGADASIHNPHKIDEPAQNNQGGIERLAAVMLEGFRSMTDQLRQSQKPVDSEDAMLRRLLAYKQLFSPPVALQPATGMNNPLEMIKLAKELAEAINPSEAEKGIFDVLLKIAEPFMPVIAENMQKQLAAQPATAAQPVIAATPEQPLTPEQTGAEKMSMIVKAQLAMLCREAAGNTDPTIYAPLIAGKVPPEMLQKFVHDPRWFELLVEQHAAVAQFPDWFSQLRIEVVDVMLEKGILTDEQIPPDLTDEFVESTNGENSSGESDVPGSDVAAE